ncbi:MAG: CBS domain-containing protein [Balneolaceae bacterium]
MEKIINKEFTPLGPSDTASKALARMNAWQTTCLPVVESTTGKLIGQLDLGKLADLEDESISVSELPLESPAAVYPHQHIFEVARQMLMHEVRMISVIDADHTFRGIAERKKVLEVLSEMLNVSVSGSVISVEVDPGDYSLSELVHLIESENARILGVAVEAPKGLSENFHVSFKLNLNDTSGISQSLRRHGYDIRSESHSELLQFDISDKADELMRYLDV